MHSRSAQCAQNTVLILVHCRSAQRAQVIKLTMSGIMASCLFKISYRHRYGKCLIKYSNSRLLIATFSEKHHFKIQFTMTCLPEKLNSLSPVHLLIKLF